jgi:predicted RNase H-like nuclease (RuvC/YqgF family)
MVDNTDNPLYNSLNIIWKQYIMQVSDTTVENMVNQLYKDESRIKQLEAEIERLKSEIEHLKAKSVAKPS